MKRKLLLIALSLCSIYAVGQYTYFNKGYLPPYPEIGSGESVYLNLQGDTLFTYGLAPSPDDKGNYDFVRYLYYLDYEGNIIQEVIHQQGSEFLYMDFSDSFSPYNGGYAASTGNGSYPLILWYDSDFFELYRMEYPALNTDSTYGEFFRNCVTSTNNLISSGRLIYDLLPEVPGQDFASLLLTLHDPEGNEVWFHEYGAADLGINEDDYSGPFISPNGGLEELSNGDILVFGSVGNMADCYAFKFDSMGNYLDHVKWGNAEYPDGSSWPVKISEDTFLFAYSRFSHMEGSWYMFTPVVGRLDTEEMSIIEFPMLDHAYSYGGISDFEATNDGNFVMLGKGHEYGGEDQGRAYLIKVDPWGNEFWFKEYFPPEPWDTPSAYDLEITNDGGFAFVGNYHPYVEGIYYYKTWVVKTDACGELEYDGCPPVTVLSEGEPSAFEMFPNPASAEVEVCSEQSICSVMLKDECGRIVLREIANSFRLTVDVSHLAPGMYLLEADFGPSGFLNRNRVTQKLVVE
jgi:hypothetical protein